jgi:hypothetical protein
MNHQRTHVELGAQFLHARGLFGVDLGGAPHARAPISAARSTALDAPPVVPRWMPMRFVMRIV